MAADMAAVHMALDTAATMAVATAAAMAAVMAATAAAMGALGVEAMATVTAVRMGVMAAMVVAMAAEDMDLSMAVPTGGLLWAVPQVSISSCSAINIVEAIQPAASEVELQSVWERLLTLLACLRHDRAAYRAMDGEYRLHVHASQASHAFLIAMPTRAGEQEQISVHCGSTHFVMLWITLLRN